MIILLITTWMKPNKQKEIKSCGQYFDEFVTKYNKSYDVSQVKYRQQVFCQNYDQLKKLKSQKKCTDCGITEVMDMLLEELIVPLPNEILNKPLDSLRQDAIQNQQLKQLKGNLNQSHNNEKTGQFNSDLTLYAKGDKGLPVITVIDPYKQNLVKDIKQENFSFENENNHIYIQNIANSSQNDSTETSQPNATEISNEQYCQNNICSAKYQFPQNMSYWSSFTLQEAGLMGMTKKQGLCRNNWAHSVNTILENLILRDQEIIQQNHPFWVHSNPNLMVLSEQYLISNLWGKQQYCEAGSFLTAMAAIVNNLSTIEMYSNVPNNFSEHKQKWIYGYRTTPTLSAEDYYLPFKTFLTSRGPVAPVLLYNGNTSVGLDPEKRQLIKAILSRGIAVHGAIHADVDIIYYLGDTYMQQVCQGKDRLNHQVTFIGYGRKENKNVWLVRNTWGKGWGSNGHFYIRIGENRLCSELIFYTLIPRYYDLDKMELAMPGNKTRDGKKDLQDDEQKLVTEDKPDVHYLASNAFVASISVLCILIGAITVLIIQKLKKQQSNSNLVTEPHKVKQ